MRMVFVYLLIALIAGAGIVALIETEPGYMLISYSNYTIETSLWVGLLLMMLLAALLYFAIHALRRVLGSPKSLASWAGGRRNRNASRMTNRGLVSFVEGNWARSRRQLLRGIKGNDEPLLNYLIAARASHQLGESEKAHEYLAQAESLKSDAGIAVALTQAELDTQAGRFEQAVATLERIKRDAGRHPLMLQLLKQCYQGLGDWNALSALLPELRKHKVESEDDLQSLERSIHLHRLFDVDVGTDGEAALRQVWNSIPAPLRKDEQLVTAYVRLLVDARDYAGAEKVLAKHLKAQWSTALITQYGYLPGENAKAMLSQAESWLGKHPDDAALLLTLGRLSARNEAWDKAKSYFQKSYALDASPEVCAELGRLLAHLGEGQEAAQYYREGLVMAQPSLPSLPMPSLPSPEVSTQVIEGETSA